MADYASPDWQAEQIRFTGFLGSPFTLPDQVTSLWQWLTGEEPLQKTQHKLTGTTEQGPYKNGQLIIQSQAGRLNCVLAIDPERQGPDPILTLGPFAENLIQQVEFSLRILQGTNNTWSRLAFGASLLVPVANSQAAAAGFAPILPRLELPEYSSDLIYRINRRREKTVGGRRLMINRLATWSIFTGGAMVLQVQPGLGPRPVQPPNVGTAMKLELDINTVPSDDLLEVTELAEVYELLVACGTEIADKGDID